MINPMIHPVKSSSVSEMVATYREILRRRRWWLIVPVVVISVMTVPIVLSLPPVYRSTTLIMVEAQKVPQEFVRTTVTSPIEDRLRSISQQILSRTRLERVIEEFRLFESQPEASTGLVSWWNRLRAPVTEPAAEQGQVPLSWVEHMQQRIEIKVKDGNTFSVSYRGGDPGTVMNVTNKLAALFIEENLKVREEQAEGTSEFLENELQNTKGRLEAQEEELRRFKERHMGELPGQLDTNLRTLDRLQAERQRLQDSLKNAEDRYTVLSQQLDDSLVVVDKPVAPTSSRLQALRNRLAALRTEYKDEYPDIVLLKSEIEKLEAQLATQADAGPATSPAAGGSDYTALLLGELQGEIKSTKQRQRAISDQTELYEQRVERTFLREQQLTQITRDYENVRNSYQSLLDKRQAARIAESLERRQKGEIFRVLDPANYPEHPFQPNRRRLILLGFALSLGVGLGLVFLREHVDPSIQNENDLLEIAPGVLVLAAVPFVTANVIERPVRKAPVVARAGKGKT